MRLTAEQAAALGRRQQQPTRQPGELLAIFVPGKLTNPLNGSQGGWQKHARWAQQWRERTWLVIFEALATMRDVEAFRRARQTGASEPKRIAFHALVPSRFDDDNLRACLKPCRDALKDAGVVDDDRDRAGHAFVYTQEARRRAGTVYGVEIRVAVMEEPHA